MPYQPSPAPWRSRGYLPHFDTPGLIQSITFRLADSLPQVLLDHLDRTCPKDDERRREEIDRLIDQGHGACWLRRDDCAQAVAEVLANRDGLDYDLIAWVIMPNHVHALIETRNDLSRIVEAWKSVSSRRIKTLIKGLGQPVPATVWQREYFDRYVRHREHLLQVIRYIAENPIQAGLMQEQGVWRWMGVKDVYGETPAGAPADQPAGAPALQREAPALQREPALQHEAHPISADRSHLATEQRHPATCDLHTQSPADLVHRFAVASTREVLAAMEQAEADLTALVTAAAPGFQRGGRLVYLGAGTSGRLGVLDASEAPPTFCVPPDRIVGIIAGGDGALRRPSEGAEDDPQGAIPALEALHLTADDTVIGIAAGGTTPYVQGALAWAQPRCLAALMTCADVQAPPGCLRILLPTGPEPLTGSTRMKAGTATKLALNSISTALMALSGKVHGNLMVDVRATNAKLRDRAARIVAQLTGLSRDQALALLPRADWSVKTAVVMHHHGCDASSAQALLSQCAGHLAGALQTTSHNGLPPAPPA